MRVYIYVLSVLICMFVLFFFFKQNTAYVMRFSDWSSDVCSSDLTISRFAGKGNASTNAAGFRFAQHDGPFICWSARHTAMLDRFVPPGKRGRHNIAARGQLSCRSANIVIFGKRAHGAWALTYNAMC